MAQEAKKPVFFLKPADGTIGAHAQKSANATWILNVSQKQNTAKNRVREQLRLICDKVGAICTK